MNIVTQGGGRREGPSPLFLLVIFSQLTLQYFHPCDLIYFIHIRMEAKIKGLEQQQFLLCGETIKQCKISGTTSEGIGGGSN